MINQTKTKRLDNARLKGDWNEVDDITTELFNYWYKEKNK